MRFPRNDGTYAATWVCNVATPSRNQVNMTVWDRLTRNHTIVDTNVEAFNRVIIRDDIMAKLPQKFIDGHRLLATEIKIRCDMPSR
jgi:hypothetical protein